MIVYDIIKLIRLEYNSLCCNAEKKGKPKRSRPKPADSGKKDEDELRKEKRKAEAAKKAEEKAAAEAKAAEAAKNGKYLSFLSQSNLNRI